jgi:DNA-binding CsgD family transcriptional regulator
VGGGQTVVNSLKDGHAVPEVLSGPEALSGPEGLSGEIEAAVRLLADKLETLIHERGHHHMDPNHTDNVLLDVEVGELRLLVLRPARPTPMSLLSPREQEIARMVARGYANKTIASVLEISTWTVASHLRRIFVKLHVSSRAAMATSLLGAGLDGFPGLLDNLMNDDGIAAVASAGGDRLPMRR